MAFTFGAAVEAVHEDLGIFDAAGNPIEIATVTSEESGAVIRLTPVDPLEGGVFGARWAIVGTDGHPVVGSITFTVEADAGAAATSTTVAGAAEPESEQPADEEAASGISDELAAVLAPPPSTTTAERLADVARFFMYLGMLLAIGVLAFLRWVHDGPTSEVRRLAGLARAGALFTLLGAALGLALEVVTSAGGGFGALFDGGDWSEVADRGIAAATVLLLVGSLAILIGLSGGRARDSVVAAGAAALLLSGVFVGHTASESPRLLVALADVAHVAAVAVWTGGVAALAVTLRLRHRSERSIGPLAVRFSVLAAYSVTLAGLTGAVLAWAILPDLGALTSTSFGRLLLAKVVLVLVVGAIGAYNHFVVVPAIEAARAEHEPSDLDAARLRTTASFEVGLLILVVAITAVLVASSAI